MADREKTAAEYRKEAEYRQAEADRHMQNGDEAWAEHERKAALTLAYLSTTAPLYVDDNVTPLRGA